MKLLLINSSARVGGNTARVMDLYEEAFWNNAGWLDDGRCYYDPAMARSPRAAIARLLGKFIALFFG